MGEIIFSRKRFPMDYQYQMVITEILHTNNIIPSEQFLLRNIFVYTHIQTHTHMHKCKHTYKYTNTYTHTHIYTYTFNDICNAYKY